MRELNGQENPEISRALATLAAGMRDEEAPAHVEVAVLAEFRKRHARRGTARFWWAAVGSVAATGLIAILAVPRWGRVEALPALKLAHARAPVISVPQAGPPKPQTIRKPVRRTAPDVPRRAAPRAEVASDFFPLGPGPLLDAGESASLLRVSLPRSVMRRFGFPPGHDPFEAVQADVVLGHDGTARAVRFVSVRR